MKCHNCNREIKDTAKFCGFCGSKQDCQETDNSNYEGSSTELSGTNSFEGDKSTLQEDLANINSEIDELNLRSGSHRPGCFGFYVMISITLLIIGDWTFETPRASFVLIGGVFIVFFLPAFIYYNKIERKKEKQKMQLEKIKEILETKINKLETRD